MEIARPVALGSVIVAGMLLLGCDVKFQRNSLHLRERLELKTPISPNTPNSPGKQDRQYDFEIARANFGGFMLPNVNRGEVDEHVSVGLRRLANGQWELEHSRSSLFPEDDLRHDINRPVLHMADRQAFPYYGYLFHLSMNNRELAHLEECTHQFPEEILPSADSRVLTLGQSKATFFRKRPQLAAESSLAEDSFETIQLVKIDSTSDGIQATIVRQRMVAQRVGSDYEITPVAEPKEERLRIGQNLVIDDQLVRVKQIVPPGEVEDAGSLIGWIELEQFDLSEAEMHRALL